MRGKRRATTAERRETPTAFVDDEIREERDGRIDATNRLARSPPSSSSHRAVISFAPSYPHRTLTLKKTVYPYVWVVCPVPDPPARRAANSSRETLPSPSTSAAAKTSATTAGETPGTATANASMASSREM